MNDDGVQVGGDVIYFSPRVELSALENLWGFIALARDRLTIFGRDLDWDAEIWDVTAAAHASGQGRIRISFTGLGQAARPMAAGISDFARAYLRYQQGLKPTRGTQQRLAAFRALDAAGDFSTLQDVTRITPAHLDAAVQQIGSHYSEAGAYRIAGQLEAIGRFLSDNSLVAMPLQWTHSLSRPGDTVRIGREHEERRARKIPSQRALEAVAFAFRAADNPSDRIAAAAAALMCCAPVRIGELLRVRANCEVVRDKRNGAAQYGLRWWSEKGVKPEVRWIIATMEDVAREALGVILELTSEARRIAAWYEVNPGRLYLPSDLTELRSQPVMPLGAADELLGLRSADWASRNGVPVIISDGVEGFAFEALEAAVLAKLPKGFPVVETATELSYSEALFTVRHNEFRTDRGSSRCMIDRVSQQQISDCLGRRVDAGIQSMFNRLGLADDDGSPLKIRSHQFRHYLNTLAQRSGADQLDIAIWSGRKSTAQNRAYDHLTADELLEMVREALGEEGEHLGPVAPVQMRSPITRAEFARLAVPTAHFTEFGACIHDFAMLPCPRHRDCLNCEEHVCVKGDQVRTGRIRALLEDTRRELAKAEAAVQEDFDGADRFLEHHRRAMARYEELISILTDPEIPDGTIVRGAAMASRRTLRASTLRLPSGNI
ncbi:MAG: integrase [Hyphomonadaceae bacterium]|nr:integrase [Hyphomonadaceae bacterium]